MVIRRPGTQQPPAGGVVQHGQSGYPQREHLQRRVRGTIATTAALILVLVASLVAVTACGSSDTGTTVPSTTAASATTTTAEVVTTAAPTTVSTEATTTTVAKLDKLTLVASPGPMAIPMAYMVVNDKLADVAQESELLIWENAEQLKAIVADGQGDFITVPSNNAAVFYNKGLKLQLLNISVWNITYLVTRDAAAASFADIKGQSLAVSLQGSVPDVMFQYIATKEGLDPTADFDLQYVSDPAQASQLLIAGEVDNAVLSEALATAVLLQTKDTEKPLRKAFAFDDAWASAATGTAQTPIAGVVMTPGVMDEPDVIAAFQREYEAAVEWMLADPAAAGKLVETELPELGLKGPVMTASLQGITWQFTTAADARPSLEGFYTALMDLSPQVIGGKLPDDGFYYAP